MTIHLYPVIEPGKPILYRRLDSMTEPQTRKWWRRTAGLARHSSPGVASVMIHSSEAAARRFSQPDPEVLAIVRSFR